MNRRARLTAVLTLTVIAAVAVALAAVSGSYAGGPTGAPAGVDPCTDDQLEDNDSLATATQVGLPYSQSGLVSCDLDDDYFAFQLSAGQRVQVDATFVHDTDADIDISLFRSNGTQVAFADSITDNEKFVWVAQIDDTFTVQVHLITRVEPTTTVASTPYALSITRSEATPTPVIETPAPTPPQPTAGPTAQPTSGPTAQPTSSPTAQPQVLGDVNGDQSVSSIDAALVLQYTAGLLQTFAIPQNANVNCDGSVDSIDASLILQLVAGLLPAFPAEGGC